MGGSLYTWTSAQPARLPARGSIDQALSRMAMTTKRTGMQLLERG